MDRIGLTPATRAAIQEAIDDIALALHKPPPPADGDKLLVTSLYGGEPGYALFYAYLDRVAPKASLRRIGRRHLDRAISRVADASRRPFFSYGFSGTGWAVEHLARWFVDMPDGALDEIDDGLIEIVRAPTVSFDIQHGLVGFGIYALERLPAPSARRLLEAIVHRLARMAEPHRRGLAWRMVNAEWVEMEQLDVLRAGIYLPGVYNGVGGVVGLLGGAIRAGVAVDEARRLLDGALTWAWLASRRIPAPLQLTWRHGRLGIAAVTFLAARAAGLDRWSEVALAEMRRLARARVRVDQSSLFDGVAGVAHVFHRMYLATGHAPFADAAHTYLLRLLRRRRPGLGMAGFRTFSRSWQRRYMNKPDYPIGWLGVPGLLNGIAGIGLALIALLHGQDPTWDRALLLSYK